LIQGEDLKPTPKKIYKLVHCTKDSVLLSVVDTFARGESAAPDPSWRKMCRESVRHCHPASHSSSIHTSSFLRLWGSFSHPRYLHFKVPLSFS